MKIRLAEGRSKPWLVDVGLVDGKRTRLFFATEAEAIAEVKRQTKDRFEVGNRWAQLPTRDRLEVTEILTEMQARGVQLRDLWEGWKRRELAAVNGKPVPLSTAIEETIASKQAAKRRERYVDDLENYLKAFARGRERMPVSAIGVEQIESWFDGRKEAPSSRASNLGRLSAMFDLCYRRDYIRANPCDRVERVTVEAKAPVILKPRQAGRLMLVTERNDPEMLPFMALSLFAGIRREEVDRLTWAQVDLKAMRVTIGAEHSKVRTRRIVPLQAAALYWLKVATPTSREPETSICPPNMRRRIHKLRGIARINWKQDILRHTAASYMLAANADAAKVARWLGNSPAILLRHYYELVHVEDAERFWAMHRGKKLPPARRE